MAKRKIPVLSQKDRLSHPDPKTFRYSRSLTFAYHKFNLNYYDGRLPNIEVYHAPLRIFVENGQEKIVSGSTGFCVEDKPLYILINKKLRDFSDLAELVLLHEIIHVAYPRAKHGPLFLKKKKELVRKAIDYITEEIV